MKATKGENTVNKLLFHVFQDERFVDLNLYQYGGNAPSPCTPMGLIAVITTCFIM